MAVSALYTVQHCTLHGGHSSSTVNPRILHNSIAPPPDCKCRVISSVSSDPSTPAPQLMGAAFGDAPSSAAGQTRSVTSQMVWVDEQDLIDAHRSALDGKMYVYKCMWGAPDAPGCGVWFESTRKEISRHLRNYHGIKASGQTSQPCYWNGCNTSMRVDSIARHMISRHLAAMMYCSTCGRTFAREGAFRIHTQGPCPNAKLITRPGPERRTVNSYHYSQEIVSAHRNRSRLTR
ncbi:hypothetical protein BJ138DRAFT_746950 [Hygrophoropsis aurantiaca]|uniref:Uncharacterized protein n=1 Tax=Hygrophoropsis aurantiaca TaxID=72124 RepID=A0ACB7ZWZ8_9AGAM|nr:hypothetical protein BJ138DRAFT_746950 [Hygrophoropsis aurantiaca]